MQALEAYTRIAVLGSDGTTDLWPDRVLEWSVGGRFGLAAEPEIREAFADLGRYMSGRVFLEAGPGPTTRITVYVCDLAEYPDRALVPAGSLGFCTTTGHGADLEVAHIWIAPETYLVRRELPRVLRHELLHAMGFDGHATGPESVLGTASGFTQMDLLVFSALYGPYGSGGLDAPGVTAVIRRTWELACGVRK